MIAEKIAQSVELLREFNVDCWITFVRESALNGDPILPFLVGGDLTWHSALIVTRKGERLAIVGEYDRRSVEDIKAYSQVIGYVTGIQGPLSEALKRINPQSIAVNYSVDSETCDGLTHGMYLLLDRILGPLGMSDRLVQADKIISALRARKSDGELAAMRKAIEATERIFDAVASFIVPGRTEREIAGFMKEMAVRGGYPFAWDPASCPAVFTGPDTAVAHYAPTDRRVEPGHIVNMDFGLKFDGYCSDLQRTFYVRPAGETDVPVEVQKGFDTIVRAIEESRRVMKPGVQGVTVDAAARHVLRDAGFAEFPHGLGHQVGRFAHDGTALLGPAWEKYASKPFVPLEERMVFTLEPRLTVEGRGVATIEEMVVVTGTGAEFLSRPQRQIGVVEIKKEEGMGGNAWIRSGVIAMTSGSPSLRGGSARRSNINSVKIASH
jgi:Xaa-Pro aminopeptidase